MLSEIFGKIRKMPHNFFQFHAKPPFAHDRSFLKITVLVLGIKVIIDTTNGQSADNIRFFYEKSTTNSGHPHHLNRRSWLC